MNKKIALTWIFLLILGFTASDFITDFFILACLWIGILLLGCSVMIKYGWSQNKYLTLYWTITLILGTILSAIQFLSIQNNNLYLPFHHISTIWMIVLGVNFLITALSSKIIYFASAGFVMLVVALPLDTLKFAYPATIYGLLLSIALIGYIILSHLTPMDPINLGHKYPEANGVNEEALTQVHKFKCGNCGYIYEGHQKLSYCPRCMASADLLIDVN